LGIKNYKLPTAELVKEPLAELVEAEPVEAEPVEAPVAEAVEAVEADFEKRRERFVFKTVKRMSGFIRIVGGETICWTL
jgi:hypothetical protein